MKRLKILRRGVLAALLLFLVSTTAFADFETAWQSEGSLRLIPESVSHVKCEGTFTASKYLVNTGEAVNLSLAAGPSPEDFVGRSSENTTAGYQFEKVENYVIQVEGKDYDTRSMEYTFSEPGTYEVKGFITFRWYTTESNEGFSRYYSRRLSMSRTIRVSDLAEAVVSVQPDTDEDKEDKPEPALRGRVSHTRQWETNRIQFNQYCESAENHRWKRNRGVYWSGEKFLLFASVEGESQPSVVRVCIRDTTYETSLHREGSTWKGSLFDKSMLDQWGEDGSEYLEFVFSARIDGVHCEDIQRVTVEDLHKYWLMHRKESFWKEERRLSELF